MSRKELFTGVSPGRFRDTSAVQPVAPSVRRFEDALGAIRDRTARAEEIEKALASGETIVEVDPALVDPSPIPDRLRGDALADEDFLQSLREKGQQIPVLLRPNPEHAGRFLTVYGHRRIAGLRALGRLVRAVVVPMGEEDAYVAQGVENSARQDLSFIERALFAARLDDAGIARAQIATALHTRQSHVSTMIALARRIPRELIECIGATPGVGRRKWEQLDEVVQGAGKAWRKAIADPALAPLDGDARFEAVMATLAKRAPATGRPSSAIHSEDGARIATFEHARNGDARIVLARGAKDARSDGRTFAQWLEARLLDLRGAWERGE